MTLLAYNSDEQLRTDMIEEVEEHRRRDQIVKGTYVDMRQGLFRGCAVGCTIDSYNQKRGENLLHSDHAGYERFGIPQILARLQDTIFEGLPDDVALDWPARFLKAIRCGADLSRVAPQFSIFVLNDCRPNARPDGQSAIDQVIALYQRQLAGDAPSIDEWSAAESAAQSTRSTRSAESAAESAAQSTWSAAESTRSAAQSAAWLARSAAAQSTWSAAESTRSAAQSAAWLARSAAEQSTWSAAQSTWSAARSAAQSAQSTWSAAESAAQSTRSAAESARSAAQSAWSAAFARYADELVRLLEAA